MYYNVCGINSLHAESPMTAPGSSSTGRKWGKRRQVSRVQSLEVCIYVMYERLRLAMSANSSKAANGETV